MIELRIIGILDVFSLIMGIYVSVNALIHEFRGKLIHLIVFSREIHHGPCLSPLINHKQRRDAGGFSHLRIIGAKSRGYMHDSGAILSRDVIAGNHPECFFRNLDETIAATREYILRMSRGKLLDIISAGVIKLLRRFHPLHELRILHSHEFRAFPFPDYLIGQNLIARSIVFKTLAGSILLEVGIYEHFRHDHGKLLRSIWVIGPYSNIIEVGADT